MLRLATYDIENGEDEDEDDLVYYFEHESALELEWLRDA